MSIEQNTLSVTIKSKFQASNTVGSRFAVRMNHFLLPCIVLVFMLSGCQTEDAENMPKNGYYVGSDSCRECHEEQHIGWRATRHPYKLQDADPKSVIGDFVTDNTYEAAGVTTKMSTKDGTYFIETAYGTDNAIQSFPVKYVIGGLWKQRYITELDDGSLMILPVQWNATKGEWGDYHGLKSREPGSGSYWSDPGRAYQYGCMGCHNTGVSYTYDTEQKRFTNTDWQEHGIACEACHGAGGLHAAAEEYEKPGGDILNPARIPDPRKAAMVCGQCHTRGKAKDGVHGYPTRGISKENGKESVMPFQPGDDMQFTFDAGPALHPDGSSMKHRQQYDDWMQSKHAEVGVMCWDCHDPHRHDGQYQRSQLQEKGSKLCLSCHTNVASTGIHGLHDVNSCVGCHMPTMATSANPYDIHSHTLNVVLPKATLDQGGDLTVQPNACNLCHYHKDHDPKELQASVDRIIAMKKEALGIVEVPEGAEVPEIQDMHEAVETPEEATMTEIIGVPEGTEDTPQP